MKYRALQLLDETLYKVEEIFSIIGIFIPIFLVYVGICRYGLKISTPYEEELSLLIQLWMVNAGFSLVIRYGDHVSVTILYDQIVKRGKLGKIYGSVIYLINVIFLLIILWYLYQTFPLLTSGVTTFLRWPFSWYYSALVMGFVFMLVRYCLKIYTSLVGR